MNPDRVFRAAAFQLSPVLFSRDSTVEKIVAAIERCGKEGIRLALFPETVVPNYPYFAWSCPPPLIGKFYRRLYEEAVDVPGPVTVTVGEAAKAAGTVVVLGVNERDGGTLYNCQLIFDSDGSLAGKRRKIMPSIYERMVWGRGDGSGLVAFDTAVGRIGALICWEHFMPLARYALIADGEQIHCSHFPGSIGGGSMAAQIDAAIRHHAVESGAFVVNATSWLSEEQKKVLAYDDSLLKYLKGGHCTAIVAPDGRYLAGPLPEGEGMAVAEIDLRRIADQKLLIDAAGHYARPDILRLVVDRRVQASLEELPAGGKTGYGDNE